MVQAKPVQPDQVLESERLQDPLNDRVVSSVVRPPIKHLGIDRVFPGGASCSNANINVELVKNYLYEGGQLSKACLLEIMKRAR